MVSLLKFSLTNKGEYLEQLSELTFLKDRVFAKSLIPSATITAFTSCVQHPKRYLVRCYWWFLLLTLSLLIILDCISFTFQEIEKYKLDHPKTFHYLNQSKCYELSGISDAHDYLATRRAMDIVGISKTEQVCPM